MAQTKACIACAESIQSGAKLCKHCGTLQDDKRFTAKANKQQNQDPDLARTKAKTAVPGECVRCSSPVSNASLSVKHLCVSCDYLLNKRERVRYDAGAPVQLCPICNDRIFFPETSSQCDKCSYTNKPGKANFLISWWAQVIIVFVVLINPRVEDNSNPIVFLVNASGQLIGWNILLAIVFAIAIIVIRRNLGDTTRARSWLYSSLLFLSTGILVLITVLAVAVAVR